MSIGVLASCSPIAFVVTTDPERAKAFYRDTLGLTLLSQDPYAVVFDLHGVMLRVTIMEKWVPLGFTVLGWQVSDIQAAAASLREAGVVFEKYPYLEQDENGIWSTPGAKVAWFKDPEGNILSISQH